MKIRDLIEIVYKKNRKNSIFIILLVILILFLLLILTFKSSFNTYINNLTEKNIGFKTLSVSPNDTYKDYGFNILEELKYVVDVHNAQFDIISVDSSFNNNEHDGVIDLTFGNKYTLPRVIIGKSIDEDDSGKAICPIDFYPSSDAFDLFIDKDNIIDGRKILKTNFEVKYYSYEFNGRELIVDKEFNKNFEVVGLYDAKSIMLPMNTCYISEKDIYSIGKISNQTIGNAQAVYGFMVTVDELSHVDETIEEIEELGFRTPSLKNSFDPTILNLIIYSTNIFVYLIIISIIILLVNFIKKQFIKNKNNIGIMLSCGYTKKDVFMLKHVEILYIELIVLVISFLIFIIIKEILISTLLNSIIYSGFNIYTPYYIYILVVLLLLSTSIITNFMLLKKSNFNNVIKIIRGNE